MATENGQRYKSGDVCNENGRFEFDGYLDGSSELLPALEEMEVSLLRGQVFPMIRSQWRNCYWKLADEIESVDDEVAGVFRRPADKGAGRQNLLVESPCTGEF